MITGVPDTKLKNLLIKLKGENNHVIASHEGQAVGIAVGYYLSTGHSAVVYMQSDGFANALNAITSLVIPYKIPIKWVISIRKDPPQHIVMGKKIKKLLKIFKIKATTI